MALTDFVNMTSATQAVDKLSSTASSLSSSFQEGLGSLKKGVEGVVGDFSKAGISVQNAITGGISSVMTQLSSAAEQIPKGLRLPATSPMENKANKKDTGVLSFPPDLGDYFISFSFYEYVKPLATKAPTKTRTTLIHLPLPPNLVEQFQMQYDSIQMGQLVNMAQEALGQGQGSLLDAAKSMNADQVKQAVLASERVSKAVAGGIGGFLGGQIGSQIAQQGVDAIYQSGGFTPNPHVGLLFKGVNIRPNHAFTYRLSPKTPAESVMIREIVRQLKVRMHPATDPLNLTFNYPDLCDITINRPVGITGELYKFKTCFLEGLGVNYAPNGVPTFFAGTREPTEIEISLSFKEAEIFTRKDFQSGSDPKDKFKDIGKLLGG